MSPLHSRIAPTPSGYLHLGNMYSFVLTWLLVRSSKGTLRLVIDDLDNERRRVEYLQDIFDTLDWLAIDYDAGARSVKEFLETESQLLRLPLYEKALQKLQMQGLLYRCVCSRSQIQNWYLQHQTPQENQHLYPQICRHLSLSETATNQEYALRVCVPTQQQANFWSWDWQQGQLTAQNYEVNAMIGDFVVRKKDQKPAYQIASLIDNDLYSFNCIVRGIDLLPSTVAQTFLANQLEMNNLNAIRFVHHPLLLDAQGNKLAKSQASTAIKDLRQRGTTQKEIYTYLATKFELPNANKIGKLEDILDEFCAKNA